MRAMETPMLASRITITIFGKFSSLGGGVAVAPLEASMDPTADLDLEASLMMLPSASSSEDLGWDAAFTAADGDDAGAAAGTSSESHDGASSAIIRNLMEA